MEYLILISFMIGILLTIQIVTSLFVYKLHMARLKTFNIDYKNTKYFKYYLILFFIYLILLFIFKISIVSILNLFIVYLSFYYLKKYFKNTIMSTEDFIYVGVALLRKESVQQVFIEHGSNLEKKYKSKYIGLEKYVPSSYTVFELNKGNYVLTKNTDLDFLVVLKQFFDVKYLE